MGGKIPPSTFSFKKELTMSDNVNKDQLLGYIDRIERMDEDKRAISEDIKEIYIEVKSAGYDAKIVRKIISIRRKTKEQRQEEETLLDLYMQSIGMA
jgi:uncharacterized protein (UPF0335 family)